MNTLGHELHLATSGSMVEAVFCFHLAKVSSKKADVGKAFQPHRDFIEATKIIEAFKEFSVKYVRKNIYGRAEESHYYRKWIDDSAGMPNINGKVYLNEIVLNSHAQYDMLCLASPFTEMTPLVIQAAFASGPTVMASKVYGNMEQVKAYYNELLFEFNSSESLQDKIKE